MSDNSDDIKKDEGTPKVVRKNPIKAPVVKDKAYRANQMKDINAEAAKNMLPGIKTGSNELKAAADTSLMGRLKSAGKNLKNNVKSAGLAASNKIQNVLNGQPTAPQGKVPGLKQAAPAQNSPQSMANFFAGKKPDRQAQMKEINASIAKPAPTNTSTVNLKGPASQNAAPVQTKTQGAMPMPGVNMKKDKLSKTQIEMLDLLKGQFSKLGKPGASEAAKAVMSAPVSEAEQKHVGKPMAPTSASAVVEKPSVAIPSEPAAAVVKLAPHEKLSSHVANAKAKNTLKSKVKAKVDAKPVAVPSAPAIAPVSTVAPSEQAHAQVKEVLKGKSAEKKFTPGAQKNLQSAPKSESEAKPEAQRSFKSSKVLPKGSPANQKAIDKQKMDTEKTADFKEASEAKPDSWSSKGSPETTEVTKDAKPAEVTAKPDTGTEVTAKPGSEVKPDANSEVTAKPGEKPAPKKDVHSEVTHKPGSPNLGVKTTFVAPTAHSHVMNFLKQLFSPGSQPAGEGQQIANASQHFMQKSEEKTEKESIGATATKIKEGAKKAPPAEKAKLLTTPENYPEHNRKKVLSLLKTCSMNKKCD